MPSPSPLLRYLPYAGALPFIACAFALLAGIRDFAPFGHVTTIMLAYGLTIVCFMAGVHWGQYVAGVRPWVNLLITSNAIALIAWGSFLVLPLALAFWSFAGLFAALFFIDTQMDLDQSYLKTRRNVTLIVCSCLMLSALIQSP
jgi:Protein of unknown function (DUF3429)